VRPPVVLSPAMLPLPIPSRLRPFAATIRLVIDTSGHAIRDSTIVCGVRDPGYAAQIAHTMGGYSFRPAERLGRPLVWPTIIRAEAP
jgi:hypothetical protein